jgi:putative ABC transport system permease protein
VSSLLSDLRYTIRELRKRPGFALTAVFSLALGIAATTAVFSVIYAVILNPFPYLGSDRIMELNVLNKEGQNRWVGLHGGQIQQLRQARSFESVIADDGWNLTTTDSDLPEDVQACYIFGDASLHFGVPALLGRGLLATDSPFGQEPQRVVALGYKFWQRYFAGDPRVVGRKLQLVHKNYEIVGVMQPRFKWRDADVYLPLKVTRDPNIIFSTSLKLRPGVTRDQANAELQPLLEQFAKISPARFPPDKFRTNVRSITDVFARGLQPILFLLLGAVALLLLIGCANVSILLLARGTQRQHELAVRVAIGAGRGRIIRQLLTESLVIAVAGAALGVLFAWKGLALLITWLPEYALPAEAVIRINAPVLLFSIALAFATSILSGLSPALQLSRPDIAGLMQSGVRRIAGGAGRRTHGVLVSAQVALTLVLLTGAAAAGKGFLRLMRTDLGYDPHHTMSVPIPVHEDAHRPWKDRSEYFEHLRAGIAALPGVVMAGISTNATPPSNGNDTTAEIMGSTVAEKPQVRLNFISPEYFPVLHIPLVQGRLWDHGETMRGATVAVINQTMARTYWPHGDAVGHQVRFVNLKDEPPYSPAAPGSDGWLQIIGVVGDARDDGLRKPIKPGVYVPYSLRMRVFTQILVRTQGAPLAMLRAVRAELVRVDPDQQAMRVQDLDAWITNQREWAEQRLVATLFGIFSTLALVLAAVGLYSVVSYGVATRTNEIGIRMALGARRADVMRIVFWSTGLTVGTGVAAGVVLSLALDRVAAKWITETSHDPLMLAGVMLLLVLASSLACLLPARRAASVAPMDALRYE